MSAPGKKFTSNRMLDSDEFPVPSAPPVVRQLKPPPEIWELVHPVTSDKFKPSRSFISRLASSWTTLVLVAFGVGVLAGVGAALWKHPAVKSLLPILQAQTETTQEPVIAEPAKAAPQQSSSTDTNAAAANNLKSTADTDTTAKTVDTSTPTAAAPETEITEQPTQPEPRPVVTRAASRRSTFERQLTSTPTAAIGARVSSPSSASSTGGQRQTGSNSPATSERNAGEAAPPKPKSNAENSPVVTSPKPATPKAKVIQWP